MAMDEDDMSMAPKRVGPPDVTPVKYGELEIRALHWGKRRGLQQNGGYLEAFDLKSGKSLWLVQIYKIKYDQHMEEDVQDRFITKIEWKIINRCILVQDEHGKRYELELPSKEVKELQ